MESGKEIEGVEIVAIGKDDSSPPPYAEDSNHLTFMMIPRRGDKSPGNPHTTRDRDNKRQLTPSGRSGRGSLGKLFSGAQEWVLWAIGYLGALTFSSKVHTIVKHQFDPGDLAIIHVHDFLMLLSGVRLKRAYGGKLIYDAHELEAKTNGISAFNSLVTVLGEKLLWKHVDGLITVSPGIEKHYLTTYGSIPSAVVLNSPKIPPSTYRDNKESDIRSVLGLDSTAILFVYVGYLQSGRGIQAALDAFVGLPNSYHVAFLGKGPLAETVNRYAERTGRIHRVNPVPHDRVVPFISTADFGLCLIEPVSRSDELALPNKLFECLAAGLPILGSSLPEIERLIKEANCGLSSGLEISELQRNIRALADTSMVTNPKSLTEYTWQKQSENLLTLYGRLVPHTST